jgi:GTP-dependent phosphoenolpyruvate carboxykinase
LTVDVTASFAGRDGQCVAYRAVLYDAEDRGWLVEGINLMRLEDGRIAYLRSFEDAPRLMASGS